MLKQIETGSLNIGYMEFGNPKDPCVVLLHGFPYDATAYSEVGPILATSSFYVVAPFLRGFGPTTFQSKTTMKTGQQAALSHDLVALLDGLKIEKAILAGYDWGGRAACIVAALWPNRVLGLVTGGGYNIQKIAGSLRPQLPEIEHRYWYQFYFHSERGRSGLNMYRKEWLFWNSCGKIV